MAVDDIVASILFTMFFVGMLCMLIAFVNRTLYFNQLKEIRKKIYELDDNLKSKLELEDFNQLNMLNKDTYLLDKVHSFIMKNTLPAEIITLEYAKKFKSYKKNEKKYAMAAYAICGLTITIMVFMYFIQNNA